MSEPDDPVARANEALRTAIGTQEAELRQRLGDGGYEVWLDRHSRSEEATIAHTVNHNAESAAAIGVHPRQGGFLAGWRLRDRRRGPPGRGVVSVGVGAMTRAQGETLDVVHALDPTTPLQDVALCGQEKPFVATLGGSPSCPLCRLRQEGH